MRTKYKCSNCGEEEWIYHVEWGVDIIDVWHEYEIDACSIRPIGNYDYRECVGEVKCPIIKR